MRVIFLIVGIVGLALSPFSSLAVEPGAEVVVIYNSRDPESKSLADYYAARREIPRSQVWGLNTSGEEEISREEYTNTLQNPLLKKLTQEKLWEFGPGTIGGPNGEAIPLEKKLLRSDIRYLVLCRGLPLKIKNDPTVTGPKEEAMRPELRHNEAAVDSELAALPMAYVGLPLAGPVRNPIYTTTNAVIIHPTNGILMVARLDGPTAAIARGLVDKALIAEKEGLWGRAYFDLRNATEPAIKQGDEWMRNAAEICRMLGFETVVDTNAATFPASFPMSQIGFYCGWYDGEPSGPFTLPEVEFMPGAFAYHLFSFSAATLHHPTMGWAGQLLANGATCTMGCTYEPFLGATPNIGMFAARLIAFGFTFGESAYASQNALSWQTTVVGDPLYRPFGRPPQQIHMHLAQENSPLLEWAQLRLINLGLAKGMNVFQAMNYLEQIPVTKTSAVLTEKMGDLCVEGGKPASAIYSYQQALNLKPTRQQRVRLRLDLAEQLSEAGKDADVYDDYVALLNEWPGYPGAPMIAQKLLALAQKLGKTGDVAKWDALVPKVPTNAPAASAPPPPPAPAGAPPAKLPPPVGPVGIPPLIRH